MEWENNDNGRQRWCVRLVQGGGFAGPLFDGFDNVYVGQPGAILSFPPTQWTRWRAPVIGMPSTPRILDEGQLLVVTHLGQVVVFDAHRGTVVGSPLDLVDGVDPTDPTRGLADCPPARPGCPVAAAPAFAASSGMVVIGLWPRRQRRGAGGAEISPGPESAADPRMGQRCGRCRCAGQPGVVGRRVDRVRQWPRRATVGAQRR
ncbi:putative pyrrolo-quinoline quinone [Mycobacterium xenopi 4042]|uniref:Putative pyrrolo-quinoline quinone n=1 Tax=Mycobacterium xenopi 4042 TaxID=1299334 RepID=X7Z5N7_MYCXE|nr:putative pyrrolo-quinoline quinone [Mycobacterium xenopi 4042]